jgi:hypothetical protein
MEPKALRRFFRAPERRSCGGAWSSCSRHAMHAMTVGRHDARVPLRACAIGALSDVRRAERQANRCEPSAFPTEEQDR